ncbi:MAG: FMN-binding protein [Clostridiales bacterium]|nr:FMN-binding protein [Clostridiales bacterium]
MQNRKFKKISPLLLTRRVIQTAAFIVFPGLFISTFSAMKTIYTAVIGGTFSLAANAGQVILVAAMLLITAMMGRFFCGFLCAFGSMGDFFWLVGSRLKLRRPAISVKADRALKRLKYILLFGIVLLGWTFGVSLPSGTGNPWTVFGMYATWKGWADLTGWLSIGALLLSGIVAGSMYIERFFCRYLCPLGAVFAIVSRFRLYRIRKPMQNCGSCQACTKRCAMGIPLYGMSTVTDSECIDCMKCVDVCPKDNVKTNPKPALAAAVAVVAMSGMYYAGNLAANAASSQLVTASLIATATNSAAAGQYIDGVYTGSASGYRGTTQVQVTVSNGSIADIAVLSTGDDAEFFNRAKNTVISEILAAQSVSVDAVSGATFSSNGIIGAVKDALASALGASAEQSTVSADESAAASSTSAATMTEDAETTVSTSTSDAEGPIDLADGTYTGSGTGFRGETFVSVTVANGYITSVTVTSYQDDERYFTHAETQVINEIIANQTPDVDAVSGATFSSNGIMEAVANALNIEYANTATLSEARQNRHGHN